MLTTGELQAIDRPIWNGRMWMNNFGENEEHRHAVERFWIVVRQNPQLIRLKIPSLESTNDLVQTFVLDTLFHTTRLKDLDLGSLSLGMGDLLGRTPELKRLKITRSEGLDSMTREYRNLQSLVLGYGVRPSHLVGMLSFLPCVKELRIKGVADEEHSVVRDIVRSSQFSQMKALQIDEDLWEQNFELIKLFLALFPGLERFKTPSLPDEIRITLENLCENLLEIDAE